MTPLKWIRQTERETGRERAEREETGRMERQEGRFPLKRRGCCRSKREERLCWWRLCARARMCVCIAHVSQDMQLTGNKQLQKSISPHIDTHRNNHTQGRQQKTQKARNTQNPTEPVPNAPLCSQMSCTHTFLHTHSAYFPYTPNTHIPPPT